MMGLAGFRPTEPGGSARPSYIRGCAAKGTIFGVEFNSRGARAHAASLRLGLFIGGCPASAWIPRAPSAG